tara:strand:- start:126 stop:386 length:261 start_codon:yes stop_codon:yes gene_type:complete
MRTCRACGGILGRDCFNESDCLQISRSEQFNNEFNKGELEQYISILIYTMKQKGITIPNSFSPEPPLVMKIQYGCQNRYIDDDLPF